MLQSCEAMRAKLSHLHLVEHCQRRRAIGRPTKGTKRSFCNKTFLQNELVCGNLHFKVTYTEKISNKLSSYSFFACLKDFAHGPIFWYLDNASTGEPKCSFAVISCDVPYSCLGSFDVYGLPCLFDTCFCKRCFLQRKMVAEFPSDLLLKYSHVLRSHA